MKKVYSSVNWVMNGYIHSLLEKQGISCIVRNQYLSGALGELPVTECWPEIWVNDDADAELAIEIIDSLTSEPANTRGSWHCNCGEWIEGQFLCCWNCNTDRPLEQ